MVAEFNDMQGIICGGKPISVNVSKYDRNKRPLNVQTFGGNIRTKPTVSHLDPNPIKLHAVRGMNGNRTFVEVACGARPAAHVLPPPINLKPGTPSKNWISDTVLVGEALSLDHMAALSDCFTIGDDYLVSLKYLGGLNVGLCFKNSDLAKEFLDDTGRWIEWFQWLLPGDGEFSCQDRIAWIKIIGLPFRCWSDDNITSIVNTFGKILVPQDEMGPSLDASIIQVGILTKRRSWINNEIAVADCGKFFNIGLVEFERNWTPIPSKFKVTESNGEESSEEESGDEEAISESEMNIDEEDEANLQDLEEGEIPENEDEIPNKPRPEVDVSELSGSPVTDTFLENIQISKISDKKDTFSTPNDEQLHMADISLDSASRDPKNGVIDSNFKDVEKNGLVFNFSPSQVLGGPFTSSMSKAQSVIKASKPIPINEIQHTHRKSIRPGKLNLNRDRFSPYARPHCSEQPPTASGDRDNFLTSLSSIDLNIFPVDFAIDGASISSPVEVNNEGASIPSAVEVNRTPVEVTNDGASISSPVEVTGGGQRPSSTAAVEMNRTVEIGNNIGFLIEQGDPTLVQIIGEHGELIGHL